MAYTFEQFSKMTAVQLRQIADTIQHDALKGHSTMHKEKLIPALCTALGIEAHVHHEVKGVNKSGIKAEITKMKAKRDEALKSDNREEFKQTLRRIHDLKRELRRATV